MLERAKSWNNRCSCSQAAKPQGKRKVQRLSPKGTQWRQKEYGASKGVGENPLNGKGMPLTGKAEGEEIVFSHTKV